MLRRVRLIVRDSACLTCPQGFPTQIDLGGVDKPDAEYGREGLAGHLDINRHSQKTHYESLLTR